MVTWLQTREFPRGEIRRPLVVLGGFLFLLIPEAPFELISPWEMKEAILHANVAFNVTHDTFRFRSPDMG